MSATTDLIKNGFVAFGKTLNLAAYDAMEKEQKLAEDSLLSSYTACPRGSGAAVASKLNELDGFKLKGLAESQFYNVGLMDYLSCLTDVTFNVSRYQAGRLSESMSIRNLIHGVRQIGAESVNGYAMKASFKEAKDLYILKSARDISNDELSHELAVGLLGTNRVRQFCPNFAYIYGGFRCSPPVIENKEVMAFCTTKDRNGIQYVVYENINPDGNTVSMAKYVESCSGRQFLQVYMQVLYALHKGKEVCDFTHYDLHAENVLIRPLPKVQGQEDKAYIPYTTENGRENLEAEGIATIIDFGNSHFQSGENNFGIYGLQAYAVLPDTSFPMYDAYKLLMFSALAMKQAGNSSALEAASVVFSFFNSKETISDCVQSQNSLYYSIPYAKPLSDYSFFDLTSFIRAKYNCDFIRSSGDSSFRTLVCREECFSFETLANSSVLEEKTSAPSSLWALYDRYYNEGYEEDKDLYLSLLKGYEEEMEAHLKEGARVVSILDSINIDFTGLEDPSQLPQYSPRFNSMVQYALLLKDIVILLETMVHVEAQFTALGLPASEAIAKGKEEIPSLQEARRVIDKTILDDLEFLNKEENRKVRSAFSNAANLYKFSS